MKRYEIVLVVLSDLSNDEVDGLIDRYSSIIAKQKGIVVRAEKWGTRKLAYRIKKQPRGNYILVDFAGDAACVIELERNLKFDDSVLRFLTIKKADKVNLQEIEEEIAGAKREKEEKAAEVKAQQSPVEEEAALQPEGGEMRAGAGVESTETTVVEEKGEEG